MKKISILVLAIAFVSMSFITKQNPLSANYKVDISKSSVKWKGYKPTGSHNGTINLVSGSMELDGNLIKSGTFIIDMSSIIVLDMPADSKYNTKLVNHLKSKDFFEIEVYKTSKFEITNVSPKEGKYIVTGKLTIKDVTKEISFPAEIAVEKNRVSLKSEKFQINRADFNVKHKSKSFFNDLKEKFINDKFDLEVMVFATK